MQPAAGESIEPDRFVLASISIDAAIFDTPIVNLRFDAEAGRPYLKSVRRQYDTSSLRWGMSGAAPLLTHDFVQAYFEFYGGLVNVPGGETIDLGPIFVLDMGQ